MSASSCAPLAARAVYLWHCDREGRYSLYTAGATAVAGYEASIRNAAQVTLTSDMVFSDGASLELATMTGDVSGGYVAALTVAVNA